MEKAAISIGNMIFHTKESKAHDNAAFFKAQEAKGKVAKLKPSGHYYLEPYTKSLHASSIYRNDTTNFIL